MNAQTPDLATSRRPTAVALWVSDLERAAAFYRDVVGVPLEYSDPHEPENVEHYEVMWGEWGDQGPVEPYLWFNLFASRGRVTSGAQLSFPVGDLAEVHQRAVAAGIRVLREPAAVPWGRSSLYEDPDGNLVSLTER